MREALLVALVAAGVLTALLTEALGSVRALRASWLWTAWMAVGSLIAVAAIGGRLPARWPRPGRRVPLAPLEAAALAWVALVAALALLTALITAPTTYDAMTYHLPRVSHWAQNQHVGFYPTHILRQLYQPPWAGYAMLQFQVLTGGDHLASLVQWLALGGCLVGTSLIARELGAGRRGQILTALICATIPMGILQATSTQNDYVTALWLVCSAYALLAERARPGGWWIWVAGASLGLAVLTKLTAYVYAIILLSCLAWPTSMASTRALIKTGLVLVACVAVLNAPYWARNTATFGFWLGPGGEGGGYTFRNSELSARILASNLVRNAALHLDTPWRPVNRAIQRAIDRIHRGIGIAPDDPRATWPGTRLEVTRPKRHEDSAGNGLHLVLLLAAALAALAYPFRRSGAWRLAAYAAGLVAAGVLFSLLLKWQPWHSRLHLPLFVLGAPLAGRLLDEVNARMAAVLAAVLAVSSLPFLVASSTRPLLGASSVLRLTRAELEMAHALAARPPYVDAADVVLASGCTTVGLVIGANDLEHVIWRLLRSPGRRPQVEHVLVTNQSSATGADTSRAPPCALIADGLEVQDAVGVSGESYRPVWSRDGVTVLLAGRIPIEPAMAPPSSP